MANQPLHESARSVQAKGGQEKQSEPIYSNSGALTTLSLSGRRLLVRLDRRPLDRLEGDRGRERKPGRRADAMDVQQMIVEGGTLCVEDKVRQGIGSQ